MLMLTQSILTETPRILFHQVSRYPMAQPSWYVKKWNVTRRKRQETPDFSLCPPPPPSQRKSVMRMQWKGGCPQARKRGLTRHQPWWSLDFGIYSCKIRRWWRLHNSMSTLKCTEYFKCVNVWYINYISVKVLNASLVAQSVKNPTAMQGTACSTGDPGSIPGSGRSPGERNGTPLQCSCLENAMDRRTWWRGHDLRTNPQRYSKWRTVSHPSLNTPSPKENRT